MSREIRIINRQIGPGSPVYIIAEMSANHHQDFDEAVRLIYAAKKSGADAVKLQTYTPHTMTIDCDNKYFRIGKGTIWEGKNLFKLYGEAYTPWEWQPKLKDIANELGMDLFSTPYDSQAVDFLENMGVPAYKIASFELVDLHLLRRVAKTGKPIIMSTGMATLAEIDEAVRTIREAGGRQLALLKCTSTYPALPEEMDLRTIPYMAEIFDVPVGISDHSMEIAVPVSAAVLGACIVEKHFTLSRLKHGPDSAFSLEPAEFKAMSAALRITEKALGTVNFDICKAETASRIFRRSLFVVEDMKAGDFFSSENVRSIRPGYGLHTRFYEDILGRQATKNISKGTPLNWEMVG